MQQIPTLTGHWPKPLQGVVDHVHEALRQLALICRTRGISPGFQGSSTVQHLAVDIAYEEGQEAIELLLGLSASENQHTVVLSGEA